MTKLKDRIDYQERVSRVVTFIHDHLDEEIDLNRLADVACLSPYHWHRIYHAMQRRDDRDHGAAPAVASGGGFSRQLGNADRGDR